MDHLRVSRLENSLLKCTFQRLLKFFLILSLTLRVSSPILPDIVKINLARSLQLLHLNFVLLLAVHLYLAKFGPIKVIEACNEIIIELFDTLEDLLVTFVKLNACIQKLDTFLSKTIFCLVIAIGTVVV